MLLQQKLFTCNSKVWDSNDIILMLAEPQLTLVRNSRKQQERSLEIGKSIFKQGNWKHNYKEYPTLCRNIANVKSITICLKCARVQQSKQEICKEVLKDSESEEYNFLFIG